jgi:hypothetical protein
MYALGPSPFDDGDQGKDQGSSVSTDPIDVVDIKSKALADMRRAVEDFRRAIVHWQDGD